MPTQLQFDTTLQPVRDIDCKIFVLDNDYTVIDEISGRTESIAINIDSESDIRRTANVTMVLKDDTQQTSSSIFYWTVGNPYWFDKYIQIYVAIKDIATNEYAWVNEGIYMVNTPSIYYDASTNNLSFEAVDLVSKLTGLRNGYLDGMTYTVEVGSTIVGAIESILLEHGFTKYILYKPSQVTVPQDINIDSTETAWDLLTALRDINSNWEMFFDVDGIFHFQEIPSGKVVVDADTGDTDEPVPVVDTSVLDKLNTSYTLETDFQEVKNYIEVLGMVHEPNEYATANISGAVLYLTLNNTYDSYLDNSWTIGFGIETDDSGDYTILANPITSIYVYDSDGTTIGALSTSDEPLEIGNQFYCLSMIIGETISDVTLEYLGFLQARAIAMETNPESPFYVGTSTRYICNLQNEVVFVSEKELVSGEVDVTTSSNLIAINVSPWCTVTDFSNADVGDTWQFKVNVDNTGSYPVTLMNVTVAGTTYSAMYIYNTDDVRMSLDFSQSYMLIMTKATSSTATFRMAYYPIPASQLDMSSTNIANRPVFSNQVKYVCSGGEYDNIYTNDLAAQRARYEVYLRSRLHDSITFKCVPIYWLDVNQIIEYTLPNSASDDEEYWLVKSIETNISPDGLQTIKAIRYYPLYAEL